MTESYKYIPLDGRHEIRLFTFDRPPRTALVTTLVKTGDEIAGSLRTISLEDAHHPAYIALSYTWGSPFPPTSTESSVTAEYRIICDGQNLQIQQNLFAALITLQNLYPTISVWIDAICVNQRNDLERNAQVSIMGDIYAQADEVFAWLGPSDEDCEVAVRVMEDINCGFMKVRDLDQPLDEYAFNDAGFFALAGLDSPTMADWQAVATFFSRTWFQRLWIVQEMALSKSLLFLCGNIKMALGTMENFATTMSILQWGGVLEELRRDRAFHRASGLTSFSRLLQLTYRVRAGFHFPSANASELNQFAPSTKNEAVCAFFGIAIFQNQFRMCSNPRDKVYSPLALMKRLLKDEHDGYGLPIPDYRGSVRKVFVETSRYLILNSRRLAALSLVERHIDDTASLPSWVVDFNSSREASPMISLKHDATKSWIEPGDRIITGDLLKVRGIFFDTVIETSSYASSSDGPISVNGMLNIATRLETQNYLGQTRVEVVFRTLVQNAFEERWKSGDPIPYEVAFTSFQHCLKLLLVAEAVNISSKNPQSRSAIAEIVIRSVTAPGNTALFPFLADIENFVACYQEIVGSLDQSRYEKEMIAPQLLFGHMMGNNMTERRMIRTEKNLLGLGPSIAEVGDEIWFLQGAAVPFLFRKMSNGNHELLGEAYVHGFMQGEIFTVGGMKKKDAQLITIQ